MYPRSSLPSFTDVRCRLPLSVAVAPPPPPPPSERWRVKGRRMSHSDRATGSNRQQQVRSREQSEVARRQPLKIPMSYWNVEQTNNDLLVFAREILAKRCAPCYDPRSALVRFYLRYRKKRVIAIPGAGRNCVRAQLTSLSSRARADYFGCFQLTSYYRPPAELRPPYAYLHG